MVGLCVLVGYRASGKTSFGRGLAERLGWAFADADDLLVAYCGKPVSTIFAERGESGFRQEESRILVESTQRRDGCVLATGGGCVERPANRALLAGLAVPVVYLHAPAAVLQERLRQDLGDRPALSGSDPVAEVPAMLARREPWYRDVASAVVASDAPVESVLRELVAIVENWSETG